MPASQYPYTTPPLPYAYDALEPAISQETMHYHHDKHLQGYVEQLNAVLIRQLPYQEWTLEQLLYYNTSLPIPIQAAVKNNGGGVYNHTLFFALMTPGGAGSPVGALARAILQEYSTVEDFQRAFLARARGQFGSGYTFLALSPTCRLRILTTANQDTPLPWNCCPILLVDNWEHAYYLQYQNRRAEYLQAWWPLINWDIAEENYQRALLQQHGT